MCTCVRDVIWLYESSHKNKFPFVPYRHAFFSTVTLYSVTGENFYGISEIGLNFIEYFSILSAIPHRWKLLIRGIGKLNLIENDIVDRLKRDPKPCKYFFKQYMLNVNTLPLNIQSKWEIKVITKLPNSEQSYKGKVQTHNYINRQNQSTTGKL